MHHTVIYRTLHLKHRKKKINNIVLIQLSNEYEKF